MHVPASRGPCRGHGAKGVFRSTFAAAPRTNALHRLAARKRSAPALLVPSPARPKQLDAPAPSLRPGPPLAPPSSMPLPAFDVGDAWSPPAGNTPTWVCVGDITRVPTPRRWLRELGVEGTVRRVTERHHRRLRSAIRAARGAFPDAPAAVVAQLETCGRAHMP